MNDYTQLGTKWAISTKSLRTLILVDQFAICSYFLGETQWHKLENNYISQRLSVCENCEKSDIDFGGLIHISFMRSQLKDCAT